LRDGGSHARHELADRGPIVVVDDLSQHLTCAHPIEVFHG
jgi:hypothetical protein